MPRTRRCFRCGELYYGRGNCASGLERCNEIHQRFMRLHMNYWRGYWQPQPEQQAGEPTAATEPAEEALPTATAADPAAPPDVLEIRLMNAGRELQHAINLMREGYAATAEQLMYLEDLVRRARWEAGVDRSCERIGLERRG